MSRPRTWYSLGFDYSISGGSLTLTPNLLTPAWQQQLGGLLQELGAGQLPAGYTVAIPSNSLTQTFAGGPQLSYRHFKKVTLFVRPSIGAIHEVATPQPGSDAIAKAIVAALAPTGKKTDSTVFYGFGGGVDFLFSKHVGLRVQADLVYDHLFSDTLAGRPVHHPVLRGPLFQPREEYREVKSVAATRAFLGLAPPRVQLNETSPRAEMSSASVRRGGVSGICPRETHRPPNPSGHAVGGET